MQQNVVVPSPLDGEAFQSVRKLIRMSLRSLYKSADAIGVPPEYVALEVLHMVGEDCVECGMTDAVNIVIEEINGTSGKPPPSPPLLSVVPK